jgi:hypothetical protein
VLPELGVTSAVIPTISDAATTSGLRWHTQLSDLNQLPKPTP